MSKSHRPPCPVAPQALLRAWVSSIRKSQSCVSPGPKPISEGHTGPGSLLGGTQYFQNRALSKGCGWEGQRALGISHRDTEAVGSQSRDVAGPQEELEPGTGKGRILGHFPLLHAAWPSKARSCSQIRFPRKESVLCLGEAKRPPSTHRQLDEQGGSRAGLTCV